MTAHSGAGNPANGLDEKRGHLPVSELKSALYAIQQPLLRTPSQESLMQDLAAQPDGNASAALKAQIDGRLTQVRIATQQDRLITPCASIVVSQFPADKWHGLMENPTTADAILDRLVHDAHMLVPPV